MPSSNIYANRIKNKNIKLSQINLQRSPKTALDFFGSQMHIEKDIIMITEPPMNKHGKACAFPVGTRTFVKDGPTNRVAILVCNPYIKATLVSISDKVIAIAAEIGNFKMILISAYCTPQGKNNRIVINDTLDEISSVIERYGGKNTVLSMDSNAHSTEWFDRITDARGKRVLEFIAANNLNILNCEGTPTFKPNRNMDRYKTSGETCIDLTLVGDSIAKLAHNWHVSMKDYISDHRHIEFELTSRSIQLIEDLGSTVKYLTSERTLNKFIQEKDHKYNYRMEEIDNGGRRATTAKEVESITHEIKEAAEKELKKRRY